MRNLFLVLFCTVIVCGCGRNDVGSDSAPVVRGISYVGLSVSNLETSRAFYRSSVDLAEVDQSPWSDSPAFDQLLDRDAVHAHTSMLRTSNAQLRLMQFENRSAASRSVPFVPVQGPGIAHVCFQAAQETGIYQKFIKNGAQPVGHPALVRLNEQRPVWYAYSRDADGIMFEVEHVDVAALDLPEPPKHDRRLRHVSLSTPDIDRSVGFYKQLLDEPKPRRVGRWFGGISGEKFDQVAGLDAVEVSMAWFQVGNLELEIFQYKSHPTQLPDEPRPLDALGYNMIVFDVSDLRAAQEKLVAAGGTVETSPEPRDGGAIFFGRDPDGNLLGFQVSEPGSLVSSKQFERQGT